MSAGRTRFGGGGGQDDKSVGDGSRGESGFCFVLIAASTDLNPGTIICMSLPRPAVSNSVTISGLAVHGAGATRIPAHRLCLTGNNPRPGTRLLPLDATVEGLSLVGQPSTSTGATKSGGVPDDTPGHDPSPGSQRGCPCQTPPRAVGQTRYVFVYSSFF